uniref:Uncharacterized protein n=1 Tax=Arundo donax TaxID=35708 RepID=A0A0A9F3J2_ARUDO
MLKNRIRWGDPMAHLVKVTAAFDFVSLGLNLSNYYSISSG